MPRPQRRRVRPGRARARGRRLGHPHVRLGAGLARDELDPPLGQRGAEAGVAAAHGRGRGDRQLRAHRADGRLRPVEHDDVRAPRRLGLGHRRAPSAGSGSPRSRRSPSSGRRPTRASAASSCPPTPPGFDVTVLEPKGSMRASVQTELRLRRRAGWPASALLPGARGLRGPFSALNEARYGIVWGALGAAARQLRGGAAPRAAARAVRPADRRASSSRSASSSTWRSSCRRARCSPCRSGGAKDAGTLTPRSDLAGQAQQRARGDRDRP